MRVYLVFAFAASCLAGNDEQPPAPFMECTKDPFDPALPACAPTNCTCQQILSTADQTGTQATNNPLQCMMITTAAVNIPDGVCHWQNLAGQTPDANKYVNYPFVSKFTCINTGEGVANQQCAYSNILAEDRPNSGGSYYALVAPNQTYPGRLEAQQAADYYKSFDVALSKYNCEQEYSHWNCNDCRKAYARWACAISLRQCSTCPCQDNYPCMHLCYDVVRMCPGSLGFKCPPENDNRDYLKMSQYEHCNKMGIGNGDEHENKRLLTVPFVQMPA